MPNVWKVQQSRRKEKIMFIFDIEQLKGEEVKSFEIVYDNTEKDKKLKNRLDDGGLIKAIVGANIVKDDKLVEKLKQMQNDLQIKVSQIKLQWILKVNDKEFKVLNSEEEAKMVCDYLTKAIEKKENYCI